MKKPFVSRPLLSLAIFLFLGVFSLMSAVQTAQADPDAVYVSVRESKLRGKADFFSPPGADVKYGDRLSVLSSTGAWYSVKTAGGKQGFIHQSAITERKVVLKASAQFDAGAADQNDIVLAGKGFSASVEREFAATHKNLSFSEVNAMERIKVSPKEMLTFAEQGQLGKKEN